VRLAVVTALFLASGGFAACGTFAGSPTGETPDAGTDASATASDARAEAGVAPLTLANIGELAPGNLRTCVINSADKAVWCRGRTTAGVMARMQSAEDETCVTPAGGAKATRGWERLPVGPADHVALAALSTCTLFDGKIRCWGDNRRGELGHPTGTAGDIDCGAGVMCNTLPQEPLAPTNTRFDEIHASASGFCARAAASVYCWGDGSFGRLGVGQMPERSVPVTRLQIPGVVQALGVGSSSGCAALAGGGLACWGFNPYGAAGVYGGGTGTETCTVTDVGTYACVTVPKLVPGTEALEVTKVDTGAEGTCFIAKGSPAKLYCFGSNSNGILGTTPVVELRGPQELTAIRSPAMISFGQYSALAQSGGETYTWGWNGRAALGSGEAPFTDAGLPTIGVIIARPALRGTRAVMDHGNNGLALSATALLGWGFNSCGELAMPPGKGDAVCYGDVPCVTTPAAIPLP
jgi:hypothetical protein